MGRDRPECNGPTSLSQARRIHAACERFEAAWRSGAINTANHCGELGRPLMAVPGSIHSAASSGCHLLIARDEAGAISPEQRAKIEAELMAARDRQATAAKDAK